jgi:hypothetical protein
MEPVTKRDVVDAKAFAEKGGLGWESIDDFDGFIHDLAQAIADGRRTTRMSLIEQLGNHLTGRYVPFSGQQPNGAFAALDQTDAASLAAVAIDWMVEHGMVKLKEEL